MGGSGAATEEAAPSSQENELSQAGVSSKKGRRILVGLLVVGLAAATFGLASAFGNSPAPGGNEGPSTTPIKHVVVFFQENESFDHYFGTYPNAVNPPNEPSFVAKPGTPTVNGLGKALLTANPNLYNPRRLDRGEALTCSQNHAYTPEQEAFDHGLMDGFVQHTAGGGCTDKSLVMDYFDGNTVTGLWNLAQNFALSDNSFDTQFGPSTVGAINLISGETHGATPEKIGGAVENGTVIGDPDPAFDDCGKGGAAMSGKNIGNLLNEKEITWGWFQGGFKPTEVKEGKAVCGSAHRNISNALVTDYVPHHNPFEYYASTSNPHHLPPTSEAMIGHTDQANHEYDTSNFDEVIADGNLPAVSFVKAPAYENGHPANSDPLDEQTFLAEKINALEHSTQWSSTAVIIAYDDSDGWYDHVMPTIVNPSKSTLDALSNPGECGTVNPTSTAPLNRCGYGPRLPLQVISPYAKQNYVDNTQTDQTSILKFIEDNWSLGRTGLNSMDNKAGSLTDMFEFTPGAKAAPKVFLNTVSGEVMGTEKVPTPPIPGGGSGSGSGSGKRDAAAPAAVGTEAPAPNPVSSVQCKVQGAVHQVALRCTVSGGGSGPGAVRFRVTRGGKVVATKRATIKGGRADAVVHSKAELDGSYRLLATVDRDGGVTALGQAVTLPGRASVELR